MVATFRLGALVELITLVYSNTGWDREVEDLIERTIHCWLNNARITRSDGSSKTEFGFKLMDGLRLLLHAHAIYRGVKAVLGEVPVLTSGISLEQIEKLTSRLLKDSEITKTLVSREIRILENKTIFQATGRHIEKYWNTPR